MQTWAVLIRRFNFFAMGNSVRYIMLLSLMILSYSAQAQSRFELKSSLYYLPEVIKVTDCVIELKEFQDEVRAIKSFTSSKENGAQVVEKILSPKKAVIRHYLKLSAKVTAKTVSGEVYWNRYKKINPRPLPKMVNTGMHERLHVLGYNHDGNKARINQESVPYKVGDIAEKYVKKCIGEKI